MKKRFSTVLLAALMTVLLIPLTAFAADGYADTVVYGTIYTAETEKPTAEAIAIKDGKYIYVGNEAGAAAYIETGVTQVIDHRGKGMVMPGCTDGHSHYTMKFAMENMAGSIMFDPEDDKAAVLQKLKEASLAAKNAGKQSLFGFGWNFIALMSDPPTLEELDDAADGVSVLIFDQGGHHTFCNSECLKRCGILDGDGNILINEIDGGYLELNENGYPTGYADERVTGYLMRKGGIDYDEIFDEEIAEASIRKTQELLLSTGYTMALDGWSNMLHPNKLYAAANKLDTDGNLKIVFPMTYEIEPWMTDAEIETEIGNLDSLNKDYGTSHVLPQYLKLFMDGVVETKTGAMTKPYVDDKSMYKSFWTVNRLADITQKCNEKGLTVHIHAMGDAAVKDTTDAYIQGGNGTKRNCLVHLRNVRTEDFTRFAEYNIACTAGMTWHAASEGQDEYLKPFLDDEYVDHAYPIKSFFDAGVTVSSHSDFPANIPCPQDPFGIMHVAVNGTVPDPLEGEVEYDESELITIGQAFQALTINGAWQFGLENERGSIKVGKWADFVLADRDVFKCEETDIGKTKVVSTWFEGEKVYGIPHHTIANGTAESDSAKNHGYIAIDKTSASEGETVTITVNPADGYQLKKLTVLSAISIAPPITPAQDASDKTKYTFKMPSYPVRVTAEFEEKAITIADILPDDFPTCVDVLPPNLWVNGNEVNMMVIPSSLVIFTLDGDGNPDYVELANDIRTATLTKNGNNYTYTNNGVTTTFLMSDNGLESVQIEGLTGEYVDFNGTYGEQHAHSFTYTANNGKITATCVDGCDDGYDTNPLTLTLTAPTSLVYDGNAKAFTFADGEAAAWTGAGLKLPEIIYQIKQSGQSTYMPLLGTLIDAGNYMAQITVDGKDAQVEFEIVQRSTGGSGGTSRYTVKFDTNGGNLMKSVSVKVGQKIGTVEPPKKEGYVFDGWFSDKELTKPFDADDKITKSTTLYANWKVDPVRQIILTIDKKEATVFTEEKVNDVAPKIVNDRTLLPIRFVAEALGATVDWDGEKRLAVISNGDLKIEITIGKDVALVNGKEIKLDSPAFIENDRTYLPLRFVAENLGATVEWLEETQQVIITKSSLKKAK